MQQELLRALQGKKTLSMIDEDWEELESRMVSSIHLSLAFEIKYSVSDEKSPFDLWEKLKKCLCQNPLQITYI